MVVLGAQWGAGFFRGSHCRVFSRQTHPTPATPYKPRQTRPESLPWQRRTTHLIEIKYCEDTCPEQQLQAVHVLHCRLRCSNAGDHVLHAILLGVGGVIYIPHTLVPLKSLGLDSQRAKRLAQASCSFCALCLFRPDVLLSLLPTFKPIRRGLLACLPATLLILTDPPFSFLVKGLFFPSGPFSFIDVRSFLLLE